MKYTTLNAEDMTQNELTSICAEIQTALNCGLTELTVEMTIGVKRTLTDLKGFLEYYRGGLNSTYAEDGEIRSAINKTLTEDFTIEKGWTVFNGNEIEVIDDLSDFYEDESLPNRRITDINKAVRQAINLGFVVTQGVGESGNSNAYIITSYNPKGHSKPNGGE